MAEDHNIKAIDMSFACVWHAVTTTCEDANILHDIAATLSFSSTLYDSNIASGRHWSMACAPGIGMAKKSIGWGLMCLE